MRVALDVRLRRGPRSSFVRVSELHEAALHGAGIPCELWDGGPCRADVLWSPVFDPAPIPPGPLRVATLHDLHPLEPEGRAGPGRWWRGLRFRRRLRASARGVARFAAVSEYTRARAEARLPWLRGRLAVVPNFAAPRFRPLPPGESARLLAVRRLPAGSVLFVAALRRHKNWECALRAWAALAEPLRARHPLVLAGPAHRAGAAPLALARRLGVAPPLLPGAVDDETLLALYASCAAFLFPSRQEGFGLPPLEAMACGAPVVASGVTALPEVLGAAADYGDPERPESFAAPLRRLLEDPAHRARRAADALARAASFDARRTGAAMQSLLAGIYK